MEHFTDCQRLFGINKEEIGTELRQLALELINKKEFMEGRNVEMIEEEITQEKARRTISNIMMKEQQAFRPCLHSRGGSSRPSRTQQ